MAATDLNDSKLLKTQAFVGGKWVGTSSTFTVEDPGKAEALVEVASAGAKEAKSAVDAAEEAFGDWSRRSPEERGGILHALYELMGEHEDDLAKLLTLEHGKPLEQARGEIQYAASFVKWFSAEARRTYGDLIPSSDRSKRILVLREPVGVAAGITPWNFPSAMVTRKLAPALAVGCCFVLKPASQTPLSALALAELGQRAGIPEGVFSVIPTDDSTAIGKCWMDDFRVRKLSFTGSTGIGKKLYEGCAETLKKLSLELGGNAPLLVFEDADLEAATEAVMVAKFRNAGQSCVAANRFYFHEDIHDELVERIAAKMREEIQVGYGLDEGVTLGPLINDDAVSKVERLVASALEGGAKVVAGGRRHSAGDHFYEPTLITNVTSTMDLTCEEIFGPVISVLKFSDESEAIRMANDTPFGLASYMFSQNHARVWRVSEALEYGMVGVNTGLVSDAAAPFGGIKASGLGREGSRYGIDDWTHLKYVAMGGL